jgi:hypothetical protein
VAEIIHWWFPVAFKIKSKLLCMTKRPNSLLPPLLLTQLVLVSYLRAFALAKHFVSTTLLSDLLLPFSKVLFKCYLPKMPPRPVYKK